MCYLRSYSTTHTSGGATPWRARSNDLAERSTALAPPCLLLCFVVAQMHNLPVVNFFTFHHAAYAQCKSVRSLRTSGESFAASRTPGDLTWLKAFLTSKWPLLRWRRHLGRHERISARSYYNLTVSVLYFMHTKEKLTSEIFCSRKMSAMPLDPELKNFLTDFSYKD